jgi:hypothetical protein
MRRGVELSEAERAEVQSFLDVGEYGLALETAADTYVEESKLIQQMSWR